MERKAMQHAQAQGTNYEPATERGEDVQEAQEQLSFAEDARERFDAARTAYSEARELGFSRTRSAYEAAREALLFGAEQETEKPTLQHHLTQDEPTPLRGIARLKVERLEREKYQKQEQERDVPSLQERESEREASVWDALDDIGREPPSPHDQTTASDAMQRVQERTTEQQNEREREAATEQAKLEREKIELERDQSISFSFGH